jgi:2-iminobutanoate/2-iminopropanoate deaminase
VTCDDKCSFDLGRRFVPAASTLGVHRSITLLAAGASGFLTLIQSGERAAARLLAHTCRGSSAGRVGAWLAGIVAASSALINICHGGRVMATKIDRIQPAGMNVRIQQGKPAYSHVVTVTGPGKTIYIAGQLARDVEGNIVGPGDMRAQLEQTFKNLDACLKAAGATWADVVKTNTFVTDYQAFSWCSDVRMRYFGRRAKHQ